MIEWLLFDINIYYNNFVAGVWLSDYCLISIYNTTTLWQGYDWMTIVWYQYIIQQLCGRGMIEWLLFDAKWKKIQLYQGKNNEMMMLSA
jgi:hypothetical protein